MYKRTGTLLIATGFLLAVLCGWLYLLRNDKLGPYLNAAPYVVWTAIGAVALICGTVLLATGSILDAIGAGRSADAPEPTPGRSHYE